MEHSELMLGMRDGLLDLIEEIAERSLTTDEHEANDYISLVLTTKSLRDYGVFEYNLPEIVWIALDPAVVDEAALRRALDPEDLIEDIVRGLGMEQDGDERKQTIAEAVYCNHFVRFINQRRPARTQLPRI